MRKGRIRHIKAFTGLWAFISCHACGSMVAVTSNLSVSLVNYDDEEGEDKPLRFLPDCGHLFHAICVDT
ncbi:hypothetical protein IEQ34_010987 [Dendrobium chrysotoxum]|uniref:RING-type domain-containing protein n=1 Tax=Dendrobium chrysotoxum TaxID=161865 RepID=A0AAV7GXY2_DENCH|nr:hypothetical protein IEQ34_010987 [Dendrobium chrysotoxum]